MSNTQKQVNFSFRCQPKEGTKYAILLTYVNDEDSADLSRNERILHPLSAFWLPFAYQQYTKVSSNELQRIARASVNLLRLQIQYIEEAFGLNRETLPVSLAEDKDIEKSYSSKSNESNTGRYYSDESEIDFSNEDQILNSFL